jgi:predicted type IV restriction endonuclease
MPFNSPLSNLSETLIQIQESAKLYQTTLKKNEAATRAVLIDPVLRALGWDTANTNMVEVEKTTEGVRADYALYDSNAIPRIIVEAKALGTDLGQNALVMTLVGYAFRFKLNDVFLTDGVIWKHFENFQPDNLSPSKTLNLAMDNPVDCAAYFVQHLDAAKYWSIEQSIDVISQRVDELENIISTLQKKVADLTPNAPSKTNIQLPTTKAESDIYIPLNELGEIAGKKPSKFRLPNGDVIEINTWKDILRESCKFTLAQNASLEIPFPDRVGKKISLFSLEKPANKVSFVTEQYNGQKIYIYMNYDSYNCVENALYILEKLSNEFRKFQPAAVIKD